MYVQYVYPHTNVRTYIYIYICIFSRNPFPRAYPVGSRPPKPDPLNLPRTQPLGRSMRRCECSGRIPFYSVSVWIVPSLIPQQQAGVFLDPFPLGTLSAV